MTFYCMISVLGIIDAFLFAHKHHRHYGNDLGNFEDSMQGRIRLMTARTPAFTHAKRVSWTTHGRLLARNFRFVAYKADYRYLPNVRTTTRLFGNEFRGPLSPKEEPITATEKQPQDGAPPVVYFWWLFRNVWTSHYR